jgi:hypothetical protein
MLQSDRGTIFCENKVCRGVYARPNLPPLARLPTDPDLYNKQAISSHYSSHPDELDEQRLKRTRTGSLNEKMFRIPHVEITSADYSSYDGIFVNEIDTTLLSVRPCVDPYTPESIDSHTPEMDASSTEEITEIIDLIPKFESKSIKLNRDRSVSPTQLKNRLDELLNDDKYSEVPELQRLDSRESCKSGSSKKGGLCCLALKCYGFCRRRARRVNCRCSGLSDCCTS